MIPPKIPKNEKERLKNLDSYCLLDSDPEKEYDDLTSLTSEIFDAPICLISLIDKDRQWFKSKVGLNAIETARNVSFCAHAINKPLELMVINNAKKDPRFYDNPFVEGEPHVVFYAGAPLVSAEGMPFGTLCIIDNKERNFDEHQRKHLKTIAEQVSKLFQLRKKNLELSDHLHEKEILMKEMHHRVKNNLQIISSLLNLQMNSFEGDEKAMSALSSSRDRIIAMSLVHQQLYQNNKVTQVELGKFLSDLISNLQRVYSNIQMIIDCDKVTIDLDIAIPLSLIISELITNSCKHGFNENQLGIIKMKVKAHKNDYEIIIQDTGKGFSKKNEWLENKSLGFEIIKTLTTQLNGNVECVSNSKGTKFTITIPIKNNQTDVIKQTA